MRIASPTPCSSAAAARSRTSSLKAGEARRPHGDKVVAVSKSSERLKQVVGFTLWTAAPLLLTAGITILGTAASNDPTAAPVLRAITILAAVVLVVLLIGKAVRERRQTVSLRRARYSAVQELHNKLGPALDLMTELALTDPKETLARQKMLQSIATQCCSALVAMTPESADVRAVVFQLEANPDEVKPLAVFGRHDSPRTFKVADPDGQEIYDYLTSHSPKGELYKNTADAAPEHYVGDRTRYQTFIRAAIFANGVAFGMVAIDAPKASSLTHGDVLLAELIAAELAPAFAIAAD